MLRNRKFSSRLRSLFVLASLPTIAACVATASDDLPAGYSVDRYHQVWERNPFTIVTPVAAVAKPKVFDKLVLLSWLNDGGKDVVFVQNLETNEVQKITRDPNPNSFRLIALHKAADPKNAEVVLSNGTEEGPVKFRIETVTPGPPQPQTAQQPAIPGAGVQNPIPGVPAGPSPALPRQAQAAQNLQPAARFGANQQGVQMAPTPSLPPRASEVRRKRITAPPVTEQPVPAPNPAPNVAGQPQTQ